MSQTLQYKGYDGSVEYSAEDRVLHGSLLGIRDAIVYEGTDAESLESSFRAAVDDYLAFCAEEGKELGQPFKRARKNYAKRSWSAIPVLFPLLHL